MIAFHPVRWLLWCKVPEHFAASTDRFTLLLCIEGQCCETLSPLDPGSKQSHCLDSRFRQMQSFGNCCPENARTKTLESRPSQNAGTINCPAEKSASRLYERHLQPNQNLTKILCSSVVQFQWSSPQSDHDWTLHPESHNQILMDP